MPTRARLDRRPAIFRKTSFVTGGYEIQGEPGGVRPVSTFLPEKTEPNGVSRRVIFFQVLELIRLINDCRFPGRPRPNPARMWACHTSGNLGGALALGRRRDVAMDQ